MLHPSNSALKLGAEEESLQGVLCLVWKIYEF